MPDYTVNAFQVRIPGRGESRTEVVVEARRGAAVPSKVRVRIGRNTYTEATYSRAVGVYLAAVPYCVSGTRIQVEVWCHGQGWVNVGWVKVQASY